MFKKILAMVAISAVLTVAASAQNQSTNLNLGTLTNVVASTTTNALSTIVFPTKNHQDGWIRAKYKLAAGDANTGFLRFTFAPSKYGTNDFDTSQNTWQSFIVTNNGTSFAIGSTNINFGAAPFWQLVREQNTSTNGATEISVDVNFKDNRYGIKK